MLPALNSALGGTWRDLGRFDRARAAYLAALREADAGEPAALLAFARS